MNQASVVSFGGVGLTVAVVLVQGAGCSYNWTFTPDPVAGDGSTAIPSATDADADAATDAAGDVPTAPPETKDSGTPAPVTCNAATNCGADKYCKFNDAQCGQAATGTCVARPTSCTTSEGQVCGCTGQVYASSCKAALSGVDVAKKAESCTTPVDTYGCGQYFCLKGKEYCASMGGQPFRCYAYTQCTTATCDCPEYAAKGCVCEGVPAKLVLTCP